MKKAKLLSLAGVSLLSVAALAACGQSSSNSGSSSTAAETSFPTEVTNEGTPIEGGEFRYALVSSAPGTGMLLDELTSISMDVDFASLVDKSMFGWDENRKLDDSGLAVPEFDVEAKTITVTLTGKDYKWSDGEPFTIDDYIFTIEQMSNKDYTGVRFDTRFTNIEGVNEFREGQTDSISGVEKIDDYTVVLHVKEMSPSMMYAGGDVPAFVMPKHIFKDIPVADWETSEYARTEKFVGMGPFKVKEMIAGESILYEANEYYFKGKPKLDTVKMDIVSPDTIVSEMRAGNYDYAEMPVDQLDSYRDLTNISLLGLLENSYEYISFNLGKYDAATESNVMDENAKMNDVNLRQAIGYAIDAKTAAESLYNGLYHPASSLIISFFGSVHDSDLAGYTYDPDKANELLDEAGYKDVDGDGIREDKDGNPLTISFAARKRTEANEALVAQYIEWWKEVGLNVELYTGRTIELNSFYEMLMANDANIDMFAGGWGTGLDPDPTGLYGPQAKYNYSRYVSDENTKLLAELVSVEAFDEDVYRDNFYAWQEYAAEQAFSLPIFEIEGLRAINNRVKYWDTYMGSASEANWENIELVSENGISE